MVIKIAYYIMHLCRYVAQEGFMYEEEPSLMETVTQNKKNKKTRICEVVNWTSFVEYFEHAPPSWGFHLVELFVGILIVTASILSKWL